jgi:hypothetical protein
VDLYNRSKWEFLSSNNVNLSLNLKKGIIILFKRIFYLEEYIRVKKPPLKRLAEVNRPILRGSRKKTTLQEGSEVYTYP